jgi:two-component sensor histidine kinase
MALIHETLYRTHKFSEVDMQVYLSTLVGQVVNTFPSPKSFKTIVFAQGVMLDLARATPAGLIINEIVTNSLKYAFPAGTASCQPGSSDPCTVRVSLSKDSGMYTLRVSDNGIGLPAGTDITTSQTLGLKLVNFLARHQLRAKLEVKSGEGTEFIFRFPE